MLLTLTTTHRPATDLGFLLRKHPERPQMFDLGFGQAHVLYPEATEERCTAALILDIDPIALVRGWPGRSGGSEGGLLTQYVNDRPYAASSFLSVALSRVFGSAMGGRSEAREELATKAIPLVARIMPLDCRGGLELAERLFAPLGYALAGSPIPDRRGGPSRYWDVTISGTVPLAQLLTHLYVLIPVLDDEKHYWVGDDEIDKLLRKGEGWLPQHPERELITRRYLKHGRRLTRLALERLAELDDAAVPDDDDGAAPTLEAIEKPLRLNDQRMERVVEVLRDAGARSVLDLGCGAGRLLRELLAERQFERIVGVDASTRDLELARDRLHLDRLPERQRDRITLLQGALTYRDKRLAGFDAAAVVEVIEHIDPPLLDAFAAALFGAARPKTVVLTTPNVEYNARFEALHGQELRHGDHRFEWTRAEFEGWAREVAGRFGYAVRFEGIGEPDPALGPPTQMGIFTWS
jgi:3' terminal RNA ribose 2'-O-methyltransferase Hen1